MKSDMRVTKVRAAVSAAATLLAIALGRPEHRRGQTRRDDYRRYRRESKGIGVSGYLPPSPGRDRNENRADPARGLAAAL